MIAYTFDPVTFEYLSPASVEASIPENSTVTVPPIPTAPNQVPVYMDGSWSLSPDLRGQTIYDQSNGNGSTVTIIGPIPSGWTLAKPPPSVLGHALMYVEDIWILKPDFRGQVIYNESGTDNQTIVTVGAIPSGWTLNPPLTLNDIKAAKLNDINAKCTDLLNAVKAGYPNDEILSWSKQETEARAYVLDNTSPCLFLSALSVTRGVTLDIMVANVIQKADQFAVVSGQIIGTRQKYRDQIDASLDIPSVSAINWI